MHRSERRPERRPARLVGCLVALLALAAAACSIGTPPPEQPFTLEATPGGRAIAVPVQGTDSSLDAATWNLEWFGDPARGPADDGLQLRNVRDVMLGAGLDVWSVQEVTDARDFADLVDQLPGYSGFLANAAMVEGGAASYSDFGDTEQKVGLVYRSDFLTVDDARVILASMNHAFAGRPPVEVTLTVRGGDTPVTVRLILLHAKAGARAADRQRRADGAVALKDHLDAEHPADRVLVLGDFNDDVDASIVTGQPSPYAGFVDAAGEYAFITRALSEAGVSSTVSYEDMIDHHLATDELAAEYVDGSAAVFRVDESLAGFGETTTDHYPVLARYLVPGARAPATPVPAADVTWVALRWDGASTAEVDVYLEGGLVRTTANDGSYTYAVVLDDHEGFAPGSTVTFRVCERLTDVCSPDVQVVL